MCILYYKQQFFYFKTDWKMIHNSVSPIQPGLADSFVNHLKNE